MLYHPWVASTVAGTDYEAALGNPGTNGYVLSSTTAGVRSWIDPVGGGTGWLTTGNALTTSSNKFAGTIDLTAYRIRTNNIQRMMFDSTTGNVGIGGEAVSTGRLYVTGGPIYGSNGGGASFLVETNSAIRGTGAGSTTWCLDGNAALGGTINARASTFLVSAARRTTIAGGVNLV